MVIADTGFFVGLGNKRDRFHDRCVDYLKKHSPKLITTWPVLTETCHLLVQRASVEHEINFMNLMESGFCKIYPLKDSDIGEMLELMKKYKQLPMDLADASLIILAQTLNKGEILTTDFRDFSTYRYAPKKGFHNLLEST